MKKTGNIQIRQTTRRPSREGVSSLNSIHSINGPTNCQPKAKNDLKQNKDGQQNKSQKSIKQDNRNSQLKNYNGNGSAGQLQSCVQLQRQMVKAETLSQQQQQQIHKLAAKSMYKKVRASESKIQNDMVYMLQQQCNKLGMELQKQKIEKQKLSKEVERLRENICSLNMKLQKIFEDNSCLSKNQQNGKMENRQLLIQLNKYKKQSSDKDIQIQLLREQKNSIQERFNSELKYLNQTIKKVNKQKDSINSIKLTLEHQLQLKIKQAQQIKQDFQQKKTQWEAYQKEIENQAKMNLEKKGEKITKYQSDSMKLQQRLKDEQAIKKKLAQKNKQLQKQLQASSQSKHQLQQTISSLRKRVNDLSILKSSNNTIMNQKILKLNEENEKLRNQICQLKGQRMPAKALEKPLLFGAEDFE